MWHANRQRHSIVAFIMVILLATAGLVSITATSYASPLDEDTIQEPEQSDVAELHRFLVENGVSIADADRLKDKFVAGKLLDSMRGVEPVNSYKVDDGEAKITRTVYPDGSVSISSLQIEPDENQIGSDDSEEVQPQDVLDCTITSGSGYIVYDGCKVYGSNGLIQMGFTASFGLVNGGYDYISWHGAPYQQCAGAACDTPYLAGAKLEEDNTGSAFVSYFMNVNIGGIASRTASLRLNVGGDTYSSDFQP